MARPTSETKYRSPRWSSPRSAWRFSIYHPHGEKVWHWPADRETPQPPPQIIAACVGIQDQWKQLQAEWPSISRTMAISDPERDWTKPVYLAAEQIADAEQRAKVIIDRDRTDYITDTARSAAAIGFDQLVATLMTEGALSLGQDRPTERFRDSERVALLNLLRPALKRQQLQPVTVEQAIDAFLLEELGRTKLKIGKKIAPETYAATRANLLSAFGHSTSQTERSQIRQTPIHPSHQVSSIDRATLEAFATFWHMLPTGELSPNNRRKTIGVTSSRTVKNYFDAMKPFLRWCRRQPTYGVTISDEDMRDVLVAESTVTEAVSFDAEKIKTILAHGGPRLRLYTCFGLLLGYCPKDIATMKTGELIAERDNLFILRERSKEGGQSGRKKRRGLRVLKIKHWIAPEMAAAITALQRPNPDKFILLNKLGSPMYRISEDGAKKSSAVAKTWNNACHRAGVSDLPFKQLRKIGYNAIKRMAGSQETAEIWDGHSAAIGDHYDDGVFEPVIDAQKRFAAELRKAGIIVHKEQP